MPKISAGCNTCRKRKKGCDMQRPSCGQCKKLNFQCGGYGRELKFIHTSSQPCKKSEVHAIPDKVVSCSNKLRKSSTVIGNTTGQALISHAESLSKSVLVGSCPGLFLNIFLGNIGSNTENLSQSCFTGWMVTTSQSNYENPILRNALLALGLARVGKLSHDPRIVYKSQQFYSSALVQLYWRLNINSECLGDESLAGIMCLTLYEVIEGSPMRGLGWASHTDGATRLIKLQPNSSKWTDFKKKLFLGLRFFAVIRAIGSRHPVFLADPEWTCLPWLQAGNQHSHQLLQLLAAIPSILQEIDLIRDDHSSYLPVRVQEVSRKCCDLLENLSLWNISFQDGRGLLHWEMPSIISIKKGKEFTREHPLFSTYIHFLDTETAHLQMLYWTAQLLICNNLWLIYQFVSGQENRSWHKINEPIVNSLLDDSYGIPYRMPELPLPASELYVVAVNVARSLEYFLTPELMTIGVTMFAFPVTVSLGYFQYFGLPEAEWFDFVFERILNSSGIDVGGFLDAVANENSLCLVKI
ncbi:Zn(2)-C6 fungal-type DNA-binding domain [Trichophyton interdigitale]|nr:Zn(2)-C6 fungal-type DNA-binding domain [Trichophyton interdigitale]KAG5218649.1 Zn(2)-C6 fungal-type DNA-binding domain [Trichophyton interdigitale]KAG8206406.1 Zn(2)-C6 fungal-type DNA-binding domain [Trichophyton interdigitale]